MPINEFFIYLFIMAGSTYLIRVIPFILARKKIENEFINSFLYYIPYTVLTAMTFPTALYITGHLVSALLGLITAVIVALKSKSITLVAISASIIVLIVEVIVVLL